MRRFPEGESVGMSEDKIKKNGRPPFEVDWQLVENLCKLQCTGEEIAATIGCCYDTLQRKVKETYQITLADYLEQKRACGRASLRKRQWDHSQKSVAMSIWLGKQWLGQQDKVMVGGDEESPIQLTYRPEDLAKASGE